MPLRYCLPKSNDVLVLPQLRVTHRYIDVRTLTICDIAGLKHIPVYAGMDRPMVRELVTAPEIHGESGLGGPELPLPGLQAQKMHAIDFIIETVLKYPGEITLVPTGPLTNIAMAIRKAPDVKEKVKEIVLMVGQLGSETQHLR